MLRAIQLPNQVSTRNARKSEDKRGVVEPMATLIHVKRHSTPDQLLLFPRGLPASADPDTYTEYGNTHVSNDGMVIQGDVSHTVKPKTVVYAVREKRSSLDVLVASLVGGAAGGVVGSYAVASRYQTCTKQKDAQERDDPEDSPDSYMPATGIPQEAVTSLSRELSHDMSVVAVCVRPCPSADSIRQLNTVVKPMPVRQINCVEPKVTRPTSRRSSVLVLRVSKTRDARYNFLVQQLNKHSKVTIIDKLEEALKILRGPSPGLSAVIVYDDCVLAAMTGEARLAHQVVKYLAEFTYSGGTTVFGPECDISKGRPSIIGLLGNIWQLQLQSWTRSHQAQFWVSQRQAKRVAGALSYYYRQVAEQLSIRPSALNFCAAQEATELYKIWGPRYRSKSERFLFLAEHGMGSVGALGKLGDKRDTSRMIVNMLGLNEER